MTAESIFSGDALGRLAFAANLAKHIENTQSGVIAIDGAWGSGKSWFGNRLRQLLEEESLAKCVWIDTFESDWDDDPALSLLSALCEQLPKNKQEAFVDSVAPLVGKGLVILAKAGVSKLLDVAGADTKTTEKLSELAEDAGEQYVKKRLKELADRKQTLVALKKLLRETVNDCGGKVVVFVDELDRCSPPYAIRFLERIKHLFAVEGVVYVLLWNRAQIQQAVKAFYGIDTDGHMYLDKFVDYPCHMPNHHLHKSVELIGRLVDLEVQSRQGRERGALESIQGAIDGFAEFLQLTAREVKHVCSWWVMPPAKVNPVFEVWLLCLKVKFPDTYAGLITESAQAHQKVKDILTTIESNNGHFEHLDALRRFHTMCITKDATDFKEYAPFLFKRNFSSPLTMTSETILRIESVRQ